MGTLKPFTAVLAAFLAATPALAAKPKVIAPPETAAGDFLVAQAAEHDGDWTLAGTLLARVWNASHDPGTLREAFLISLGAGNVKQALDLATDIKPAMPELGVATALRTADAIHRGDLATAAKLADDLPEKGVGMPLRALLQAWLAAENGDRTAALASLEQLKDFESYRKLHAALIEEYLAGRKSPRNPDRKAADAAYAALAQDGPLPRVASIAADYYHRTGRPALAAQTVAGIDSQAGGIGAISVRAGTIGARQAPTPVSGAAEAFYDVSELLLEANHPDVALFYAQIATYLDPAKPDAHLLLGEIEQAEGRHVQAAADFMAVPANCDFGLLSRLDAILAYDDADKHAEALTTAAALVKDRPTLPEPVIELGDVQRRNDHYQPAIKAYDTALKIMKPDDPRQATVLFARAIAHDSLHDDAAAEADLKQAVALAPERATLLNYLGYFWVSRARNLDVAQTMLEHAWKLAPTDGAIADSLGWALYQRGDYKGAIDRLEEAVQMMPGDSEINAHLGDAYWQIGRHADARFQWRHALLNASSETAPVLKVKLNEGLGLSKPLGENHAEMDVRQ